ncbi:MAG: chemotaxis protein CheB [SAR324 cluster bacterium]|nr:chemotaxis protein CheB [SAR324 cluster bacterium]
MKKSIEKNKWGMVVVGCSSGGLGALKEVLFPLPSSFPLPIIIVQHLHPEGESYLASYLDGHCQLSVKEAEDKEKIDPGFVYTAPPNYHVLIEKERTLSLSVDAPVVYSRPSIDVLFESVPPFMAKHTIAILLTGANNDGTKGMLYIHRHGGLTIVQNPENAESSLMPQSAINAVQVDHLLDLEEMAPLLIQLSRD